MRLEESFDATPAPFQARYLALRVLGEGSFGRVILAEDRNLGRKVAIKVVTPERQREAVRFEREAALTARLVHPGVVRVFDFLLAGDGRMITVYEYIEGPSLEQVGREPVPPSLGQVASWGIELAEALGAAHRTGILHRDIKPANVMVRPSGQAVLVDFGLGKDLVAPSALTADGYLIGTPGYMAPELWRGEPPTAAGDQFGLGATLFRLLAGRPPFDLPALAAYGSRAGELTAVRLSDPIRQQDPGLAAALERALEVAPSRRFPDLAAFGRALERTPSGGASVLLRRRSAVVPTPLLGTTPAEPRDLRGVAFGTFLLCLVTAAALGLGRSPAPSPGPDPPDLPSGPAGPTLVQLATLEEAAIKAIAPHRNVDGQLDSSMTGHMVRKLGEICGPDADRRGLALFRQAGEFADAILDAPSIRVPIHPTVREALFHLAADSWLVSRTLDRPDRVTEAIATHPPAEAAEWVRRLQASDETIRPAVTRMLDRARGRTAQLPSDLLCLYAGIAGRMRLPMVAELLAEIDDRLRRPGDEDPDLARTEEEAVDQVGISPVVPCEMRLAVMKRTCARIAQRSRSSDDRYGRSGIVFFGVEALLESCRVLEASRRDEVAGILATTLDRLSELPAEAGDQARGWVVGRAKDLARRLRAGPDVLGSGTPALAASLEAWMLGQKG